MDRLERYVAATLAGSCLGALVFMQFLSMLVDLLMQGPEYFALAQQEGRGTLGLVGSFLWFHACFAPVLFVTVAPFVTVIGTMFGLVRLLAANEIVPMLFVGRSMYRILRPAVVIALLIAAAMAATWEFVIPNLAATLRRTRATLAGTEGGVVLDQLILRVPGRADRILAAYRYDHARMRLESVHVLDRGADPQDTALITATAADWNPERRVWELTDGVERRGNALEPVATVDLAGIDPELLVRSEKEARQTAELSYSDLLELRALRPGRADFAIAFHHHLTFPLANLLLLLLALPFAISFERGSKIGRILVAILICAGYFVSTLICQSLGQRELDPLTAAWAPTVLFGSFGIVLASTLRT
jgi:lipopolysaccharide export system permease protein